MGKRKRKHISSTEDSDSSCSDSKDEAEELRKKSRKKEKKEKLKKANKKKKKKRHYSSSSDDDSASVSGEKRRDSTKKKSKKSKKKTSTEERLETADPIGPLPPTSSSELQPQPIDAESSSDARSMAPMTKEAWEKRRNQIRRVFDETTGRHRLIRGDGEVLEEIVSRERHRTINRQATLGDGLYFQSKLQKKL